MLRDDAAARKFEALFGPESGHDKPIERARVRKALTALNSPQWNLPPTFHVAGGVGKSSTIAFMRAIAEAAGLSVHVFSGPHLLELRERFRVAGKLVSTQELIDAAERLSYLRVELTHFEAQVVCAFSLFANHEADLTFIEAGDGGRDDATNVIPSPVTTILTTIALAPDVRGEDLAAFARNEGGVMKGGAPMVLARQHEDVKLVLEQMAGRLGTPLFGGGVEWNAYASVGSMSLQYLTRAYDLPPPALLGAHQIDNAGLAAAALLTWGDRRITRMALATGMTTVQARGRLELLPAASFNSEAKGAEIWVDCGGGARAGDALAQVLREMTRKRAARSVAIVGLRPQADWRAFVQRIAPEVGVVIGVPLGVDGVEAAAIAAVALEVGVEGCAATTLRGAIRMAGDKSAERILICGSFALAGEALREAQPIS